MDISTKKCEQNRYHAILNAKQWELNERFQIFSTASETVP